MGKRAGFKFDPSETFPHLPSAPIVEAVINWTARAGKETPPDELKKQLCDRLPNYPECQPTGLLQIASEISAAGASESRRASWHGLRFASSDKMHIVQFNRDGLVFSRLQPYPGWADFSSEGLRLWGIFLELFKPSEVQRLGVRFINRITVAAVSEMGKYLANPPQCLEPLGLPLNAFLYQSVHDVPNNPYRINVTQTIQAPMTPQTEGPSLIFDIDVFTTQGFPCEDEILKEHLAKMRWVKNRAFFNLMKEPAVKKFKRPRP